MLCTTEHCRKSFIEHIEGQGHDRAKYVVQTIQSSTLAQYTNGSQSWHCCLAHLINSKGQLQCL